MQRLKILLLFSAVVAIGALVLLGLRVHVHAVGMAASATTARLDSTGRAYRSLQVARARELTLVGQQLAIDKAFVGYVAHALSGDSGIGSADTASIRDLLEERRAQLDFDIALVLDPTGRTVVDTSAFQTTQQDLSRHPAVSNVLRSLEATTGHLIVRGKVLQVSVTPLLLGANSVGMLMVGLLVDDDFAAEIRAITQVDVAIVANDSDGPIVAASTLDAATRASLPAMILDARLLNASTDSRDRRIQIGAEPWRLRLSPPQDHVGDAWLLTLIPSASADGMVAATDSNLLQSCALAGLAILIVFAALWIRILIPLSQLSISAQGIHRGLLEPTKIERGSALSSIGLAINRVMGELRESREFESYTADLLRQRTRAAETGTHRDPGHASPPDAIATLATGTLVADRYELYGSVAASHAGVDYRALDRKAGEVVALTVISSETLSDRDRVERMKSLLRSAAQIHHPNVARLRDMGQANGIVYVASEYVRGISLREALERTGRIPLYAGLRLARQVCAGLAAVHQAGQPHGAVNSSNVVLEPGVEARLLHCGILAPRISYDRTQPDLPLHGEVPFLSPQSLLGEIASFPSDIYAVGVMLTGVFTARLPHNGSTPAEIALARVEQEPIPPSRLWTEIPRSLERILLRCLQRDPTERYPNAEALRRDLDLCRL